MPDPLTDRREAPEERVAALRLFRLVIGRFRDGWRSLPPSAWRRWLITLVVGLVICAAFAIALVLVGQRLEAQGLLQREQGQLARIQGLGWFEFHTAIWLGAFGSSAMHIPIVVVAAVWAALARRPLRALSVLASYLLIKLLLFAAWSVWDRPRPELLPEAQIDVPASLHSYPSGHMVQTVAVYGILAWFWIAASRSRSEQALAWALLAGIACVVGLSRMRVDAHWPSDIVAGALLGAAWLGVLIVALRRAERHAPPEAPQTPEAPETPGKPATRPAVEEHAA